MHLPGNHWDSLNITEFGLASAEELDYIRFTALAINRLLTNIFADIGIVLVDFKLEFGRPAAPLEGEPAIILADEISPDNCRLWDRETGDIKDKDRFRKDLGGLVDAYQDIASRFGLTVALMGSRMLFSDMISAAILNFSLGCLSEKE